MISDEGDGLHGCYLVVVDASDYADWQELREAIGTCTQAVQVLKPGE